MIDYYFELFVASFLQTVTIIDCLISLLIHILLDAFAWDRCSTVELSAFASEMAAPEVAIPPVLLPGFA